MDPVSAALPQNLRRIFVATLAQVANLRASDWRVNSLGRNYSHSFGYGVMDASGMVKMAQMWKNVGPQVQSAVKASIGKVSIPGGTSRTAKMEVTDHGDVNFLEHVQVGLIVFTVWPRFYILKSIEDNKHKKAVDSCPCKVF